jgi:tetratricopeptide (TPR) repeat protein
MKECLRLSELANYLTPQALTRADLAAVYEGLGAFEQGLETIHLALTVAETHMPIVRPYVLTKLAQLHLRQSHLDEAEVVIDQGKREFNREGTAIFSQFVFLAEAELALKQGDYERALAATDDFLATLHQFGIWAFMTDVLVLRGQILRGMGQTETARKTLLEAQAAAEAIGSRRMLWQILFALSQLETDPAKIERLHQQAQEIVQSIANSIGNPELRASFLGLAEVQEVLSL